MSITSVDALRALYATPGERAVKKQLSSLDRHCRRFIELSPFLVLATAGATGTMDASPRGGVPGFFPPPVGAAIAVSIPPPLVRRRDRDRDDVERLGPTQPLNQEER